MIAFFRNLFLHDFWLKLFSLALAILIWLTVWFARGRGISPMAALSSHDPQQTFFNLPILVRLPASDVRTVEVNPEVVAVTVQGKAELLEDLKSRDIRAEVDLTGIESARGLRKRIEIILPPGVRYTRIVPDEVEVIVPPKN